MCMISCARGAASFVSVLDRPTFVETLGLPERRVTTGLSFVGLLGFLEPSVLRRPALSAGQAG